MPKPSVDLTKVPRRNANCPICRRKTARVTFVIGTKGTKRQRLLCYNPACRYELG